VLCKDDAVSRIDGCFYIQKMNTCNKCGKKFKGKSRYQQYCKDCQKLNSDDKNGINKKTRKL